MKTDKTYNSMRNELECNCHNLIRQINDLNGQISYLEETLDKYRKLAEQRGKMIDVIAAEHPDIAIKHFNLFKY